MTASREFSLAPLQSQPLTQLSRPKDQPKQVKPARGETTRGRGDRRGGKAGRGKPKTAQELDAEMTDYFDAGTGADASATNGVAPTTNGGDDLGMDGVSVSTIPSTNLTRTHNT